MDAQVKKALAKWPNLPHCYGWLALDARGAWRMRNEKAQQQNLRGDKIVQPALLGFINRNYTRDEQGRWYFQNGPQRVYVDLEAAPYVARTDPTAGLILQTGDALSKVDAVWLSNEGRLWVLGDGKIALLDDRDLTQCVALLHVANRVVTDEELVTWLDSAGISANLTFIWKNSAIDVRYLDERHAVQQFGFVLRPRSSSK